MSIVRLYSVKKSGERWGLVQISVMNNGEGLVYSEIIGAVRSGSACATRGTALTIRLVCEVVKGRRKELRDRCSSKLRLCQRLPCKVLRYALFVVFDRSVNAVIGA